jgi:type I restriction enzyme S subunit
MSEWQKVKIGDLFNIEKGSLQSSKCTDGNFDFITASSDWKKHNEYTHDIESLIVAVAASGSLGRVHYVNGKFISSDLCFILTPKNPAQYPINLKFYFHIIRSIREDLVQKTATGTSKLAINKSNFSNYMLPYFDIDHQKKFCEKLILIENKKNKLQKSSGFQQSQIALLRQQILQDAISGKLTEDWRENNPDTEPASKLLEKIKVEKAKLIAEKKIKKENPLPKITKEEIPFELPEKWQWCRLGEVVSYKLGKTPPSKDTRYWENGEYEWVSISDMTEYGVIQNTQRKVTQLAVDKVFKYPPVPKGTLLMSFKLTIGRTSILEINSYHNEAIISIYPYHNEYKKFLFYFLPIFSQWGNKRKAIKGNTLNSKKLNNLTVPLPPLAEQKAIVAKVEKLLAYVSELEEKIKQNKQDAEILMQTFLAEAFKN